MATIGLSVGSRHRQHGSASRCWRPRIWRLPRPGTLDTDRVSASLTKAGITADDALLVGLVDEAAEHADRVALERSERARLERTAVPLVTLPYLSDGVDLGALYDFADGIRAEGEG